MMDLKALNAIQHELNTQDNAITADPLFCVYQKRRICGMDPDYSEQYVWVHVDSDYAEADEKQTKTLDRYEKRTGEALNGWRKVYYYESNQFVTACLTRKGCEEFLRVNGHNLRQPFIYVQTLWRNEEMKDLRNALLYHRLLLKCPDVWADRRCEKESGHTGMHRANGLKWA